MKKDDEIYKIAEITNCKSDFELFLNKLIENLKKKEDWENDTLDSYLEGLSGYVFDSKIDQPTWKNFAEILLAARVYE